MISTSTSPALGPPISMVSIVSGLPAFQATAARDFMGESLSKWGCQAWRGARNLLCEAGKVAPRSGDGWGVAGSLQARKTCATVVPTEHRLSNTRHTPSDPTSSGHLPHFVEKAFHRLTLKTSCNES